jgi:hypothetical protein
MDENGWFAIFHCFFGLFNNWIQFHYFLYAILRPFYYCLSVFSVLLGLISLKFAFGFATLVEHYWMLIVIVNLGNTKGEL